jgi:hypothetical protein
MSKSIIALAIIFVLTFIAFDAIVASGVVIAAALLMLIPGKAWLAIGRAAVELSPYILFATLLDN